MIAAEVDRHRIERRLETKYLDVMTESLDEALTRAREAADGGRPLSIGLLGNAADVLPEMVRRGGLPEDSGEGVCPWLEDGLCANREGRALACRTYFCSDEGQAAEVLERWHGEIRRIHERHGLPYHYAGLTDHLNFRGENTSEGMKR